MNIILWTTLIYIVGIVLLGLGSIYYSQWWVNRLIGKNLKELDCLITGYNIPTSWGKKKRSPNYYIKKVDKLIKFVKVTHLVDKKEMIIEELEDIKKFWREHPDELLS